MLHPGGQLGKKLLRVEDKMHTGEDVPRVHLQAKMKDVLFEMTRKRLGMTTVVDDRGRLRGILSDGDLRRHMGDSLLRRTVATVMRRRPKTITAAALAADALGVMNRFAITSLFVVDEAERPVGFLHMHDCLRAGVA